MDVDESFKNEEPTNKCYLCNDVFKTKDDLRKHKKSNHPINVPLCEKFLSKQCDRSDQQCWYKHESGDSNSQQKSKTAAQEKKDFCEATQEAFPPDHVQKMMEVLDNLCSKIEKMEKRFKDLMN